MQIKLRNEKAPIVKLRDLIAYTDHNYPPKYTELTCVEEINSRKVEFLPPDNMRDNKDRLFPSNVANNSGFIDLSWYTDIYIYSGTVFGIKNLPNIDGRALDVLPALKNELLHISPSMQADSSTFSMAPNSAELPVSSVVNDKSFLVTLHPAAQNYYHYMIEYLPYFGVKSASKFQCLPILYAEVTLPFHFEAMDLLLGERHRIHSLSEGLLLKDCAIPSALPKAVAVDFLRERSSEIAPEGTSRRIYISRRNSPTQTRRVLNEDELSIILIKYNFEIVDLENISVAKQIATFKAASIICAPHGAGLTNIAFAPPGTIVVEFLLRERLPFGAVFWELARAADLRYNALFGRRVPNHWNSANEGDMIVDIHEFELLLIDLLP